MEQVLHGARSRLLQYPHVHRSLQKLITCAHICGLVHRVWTDRALWKPIYCRVQLDYARYEYHFLFTKQSRVLGIDCYGSHSVRTYVSLSHKLLLASLHAESKDF